MIVAFDFEHREPAVTDIDGAGVLAFAHRNQIALRGQSLEMTARRFVGTMLRPHHREHAELSEGRRAPEKFFDEAEFVVAQSVRVRLREIDIRLAGERHGRLAHGCSTRSGARCSGTDWKAIIDSKILRPSAPNSAASSACSGCGIRPKQLTHSS